MTITFSLYVHVHSESLLIDRHEGRCIGQTQSQPSRRQSPERMSASKRMAHSSQQTLVCGDTRGKQEGKKESCARNTFHHNSWFTSSRSVEVVLAENISL